jgi:uncharacterized Zn finger protein (UPF0148 family)
VSWKDRIPDGVGDVEPDDDGFTAKLSLPTDDDGFFGRACPVCEGPFKMHAAEYKALPEEVELHCPYCGHHDEHSQFLTPAQRERAMAALHGLAEQYVHDLVDDIFGRTFGSRSRPRTHNSMISIETRYTPGAPPPIRALPEIVEEQTRRVIACSACGNRHAVYSAAVFCPVCGLRPATDTVLEQIRTARAVFALEDETEPDRREALRAMACSSASRSTR